MFQPPTDNLYKFMAIVGLLLWVGGLLYPWTKAYEVEREVIMLEAEVKYAQEHPTESNPIDLEKKLKLTRLLNRVTVICFAVGVISSLVGGFLTFYGFRLWYIRVQKPLDKQNAKSRAE